MTARSYSVRLGAPYSKVKRQLELKGWRVDAKWVQKQPEVGRVGELLCGAGYDALCSTAMVRGDQHAYLTLSGTNQGEPLVGIADHE